ASCLSFCLLGHGAPYGSDPRFPGERDRHTAAGAQPDLLAGVGQHHAGAGRPADQGPDARALLAVDDRADDGARPRAPCPFCATPAPGPPAPPIRAPMPAPFLPSTTAPTMAPAPVPIPMVTASFLCVLPAVLSLARAAVGGALP